MDIKLNWLSLKNFKGIKGFTLKIDGKTANVYGDNGAGKTSLADAFLWLLFNKDSTDRTQFAVKPQDKHGNDIHNLQTEVEAELLVDGKPLKLRKILEEKWTRKRGSTEAELTGHTVKYWWDEESVKEREYKSRMSQLIDEDLFRMITNPMYFNTKVKWEERRKMLLTICGDKTDEEVIESDKSLAKLKGILQGKSVGVYKKIVEDKLKTLEKEIKNIPPRIDELMLTLPKEEPDYSTVEKELQKHKNELDGIETKLSDAMNLANEYSGIQQVLSKLKLKLQDVKAKIDAEAGEDRKQLVMQKAELSSEKMLLESGISNLEASIEQIKNDIESNTAQRSQLVNEWEELTKEKKSILGEEFTEPDEDNFLCPTCGQDLPEDAKEQKISELQENFQADKNKRLAEVEGKIKQNVAKGKSVRNTLEQAQTKALEQQKELEEKQKQLKEVKAKLSQIEEKLSKPTPEPDYNSNEEYASLQKQIQVLQAELDRPREDKTTELMTCKREIQAKIDGLNQTLSSKTAAGNTQKRIDELKAEERDLAQQITELEGHKYLIEQFNIAKVNMLEDKINSRFKHVRFKLFDQQLNGNIVEICQALVNTNGVYVPFDDANHAGKVNAGLDIINSLCEYYEVTAPMFIDFRESVTKIIDTDSQVINLIKNESDKALRVEVEE
jgi:exonuclease SbcC